MKYLLHGRLIAKENKTDELAGILLEASRMMATAKGCNLYVVGRDGHDANAIWVTEIWDTKEDHDNSLNVEGVRDLISKAIPILEDAPQKGQELQLLGGHGI